MIATVMYIYGTIQVRLLIMPSKDACGKAQHTSVDS